MHRAQMTTDMDVAWGKIESVMKTECSANIYSFHDGRSQILACLLFSVHYKHEACVIYLLGSAVHICRARHQVYIEIIFPICQIFVYLCAFS